MSISPSDQEKLAREVRRIYEDAELRILILIAKNIKEGIDTPNWQRDKLSQINKLRVQVERELDDANKQIPKLIKRLIEVAYKSGSNSVIQDLIEAVENAEGKGWDPNNNEQLQLALEETKLTPKDLKFLTDADIDTMTGVNTQAIIALAGATTETVTGTKLLVVRQTLDAFRDIITEVAGSTLTGADTRLQIADRALARFIDSGIASFVDKSNRTWNISSYTEMATRTAIGQASIEGHMNQNEEMGLDLVRVSDHEEECKLCRPYEGKIYSQSGKGNKYPSLQVAIDGGLFHPNCGHRLQTYIQGLTKPIKKTADPEGDKERQQHRYLERQLRKWKKREMVAMSKKEKAKAAAKVNEYKERMEDFINDTERRRKRNRERVPDVAR